MKYKLDGRLKTRDSYRAGLVRQQIASRTEYVDRGDGQRSANADQLEETSIWYMRYRGFEAAANVTEWRVDIS